MAIFTAFYADIDIPTSRQLYVLLSLHPKSPLIFLSVLKGSETFFIAKISRHYHPAMTF